VTKRTKIQLSVAEEEEKKEQQVDNMLQFDIAFRSNTNNTAPTFMSSLFPRILLSVR